MQRIEKESGEDWTPLDNACVIKTLASIAADISRHPIQVSDVELTIRKEHQLQLATAYFQNSDERQSQAILANNDKERMSDLIDTVIQKRTPIGRVLSNCKIRKVKGDMKDAKRFIKQGYQVGMFFNSGLGKHMFHLGIDAEGNMYNNSDAEKPSLIARNGYEEFMNELMWDAPPSKNIWNLLLIKPKK